MHKEVQTQSKTVKHADQSSSATRLHPSLQTTQQVAPKLTNYGLSDGSLQVSAPLYVMGLKLLR